MEKYIVKTELPDAKVGTEVLWDESTEAYYYLNDSILPTQKHYLSKEQVVCGGKYFCKAIEYPEYYAFMYPLFSRNEVLTIMREAFPNRSCSGMFNVNVSKEMYKFQELLRTVGLDKAHKILDKK